MTKTQEKPKQLAGALVTIVPWRRDADEPEQVYLVTEDNGDRLFIQPTNSSMAIVPTELVARTDVAEVDEPVAHVIENPVTGWGCEAMHTFGKHAHQWVAFAAAPERSAVQGAIRYLRLQGIAARLVKYQAVAR